MARWMDTSLFFLGPMARSHSTCLFICSLCHQYWEASGWQNGLLCKVISFYLRPGVFGSYSETVTLAVILTGWWVYPFFSIYHSCQGLSIGSAALNHMAYYIAVTAVMETTSTSSPLHQMQRGLFPVCIILSWNKYVHGNQLDKKQNPWKTEVMVGIMRKDSSL